MKTNKELREIAKDRLVSALASAYYAVCDNPNCFGLNEAEADEVVKFMNSYGKTMCKAIRRDYYTN